MRHVIRHVIHLSARLVLVVAVALSALMVIDQRPVVAQQVQVSAPMTGVSDSFYERFGTSWGFSGGGRNGRAFFNFGGPNPGLPPFGGLDPNADARFGLGGRWGGGSAFFQGFAGQGSSRTIVSETPTIVIPNGGTGSIFSGVQRPFVTGVVPVVGRRNLSPLLDRIARLRSQPPAMSASRSSLADRRSAETDHGDLADHNDPAIGRASASGGGSTRQAGYQPDRSTAGRGDLSVAEIQRRRESEQQAKSDERRAEVERLIERGRGCEQAGKLGAASIYYKRAARQADGPLRQQLLDHVRGLRP